MSKSKSKIIKQDPFSPPLLQYSGAHSVNTRVDVCRAPDSPGSLGGRVDRARSNHISPVGKAKMAIEFKVSKSVKFAHPLVVGKIAISLSPLLLNSKANQKIKIDLSQQVVEYEAKLGKLTDDISLAFKTGIDFKKLMVAKDEESFKEAFTAKLTASMKKDWGPISEQKLTISASALPIELAFKTKGLKVSEHVQWQMEVSVAICPAPKAIAQMLKNATVKVGQIIGKFLWVYCRALVMELIASGVLAASALVVVAGALSFGFVAGFMYLLSAPEREFFKYRYTLAYVTYLYGPSNGDTLWDEKMTNPETDFPNNPDTVKKVKDARALAKKEVLSDVRNLAATLSPGTPWSDDFMKELFIAKFNHEQKINEGESRKRMYYQVFNNL
jgi:hypothetical protein